MISVVVKNAAKIQRNIVVNRCVLRNYIKWRRFCTKCRSGSMKYVCHFCPDYHSTPFSGHSAFLLQQAVSCQNFQYFCGAILKLLVLCFYNNNL